MRKLLSILAAVLITATVWAQSPQKMSYQAVIRDADNKLITSHSVGMRVGILQGSASGTAVYTETQTTTTNANGLVSIEIGGAGFDAINWASIPYFIKTETDPTGGTNYTITDTSQLLCVPYALYAKSANVTYSISATGDTMNLGNGQYIFIPGISAGNEAPVPPTISSFSPLSGAVGATVTITGTNFNATPSKNIVFLGATRATVSAATKTSLTVAVPSGATYAPITVLNYRTMLAAYSLANFTPTFSPAKASISTDDFATKVDFATGSDPASIVIGDIDADGKPDLAVANWESNTISVFHNTGSIGNISFAPKVDFATGTQPRIIAIGDIDGDGKPDLAVANQGSNTASVFRNMSSIGSISFAAKLDFATDVQPACVAIGDIDEDGKPELAVANYQSETVSVLRNTGSIGSINFAAKVDFATGNQPRSVAIGDLNEDGKPDLAVANASGDAGRTISVFRNTGSIGSISFATKVDYPIGPNPFCVAIGDIDGDGKPDLITANKTSPTVSVLLNTGSGVNISFAAKVDFVTGSAINVSIGDINGDGKPDLATANANAIGTVSVLINTGNIGSINFATKVDLATDGTPISVLIGDMDGDGKPDLATANEISNNISVLRSIP